MSFADLALSAQRVQQAHPTFHGVSRAGSGWVFADTESSASQNGQTATVPEAKALVATCLGARLGAFVSRYGSPEEMLDAVADEPRLAASLQTLLAYAYLVSVQQAGRNSARDLYAGDAEHFERRLKEACLAVAHTAPHVLGLTASSGGGRGGSVASVYT